MKILRTVFNVCYWRFFKNSGVIQYRHISTSDIKHLEETISHRKEVFFTPCSTGLGRPFSHSDVHVYAYVEDEHGNVVDPENFSSSKNLATYRVSLDELYTDALKDLYLLCKTGKTGQPGPITALLNFLTNRGKHEESLHSMHKGGTTLASIIKADKLTDTEIRCLLAVHLVSQLVVQSSIPCMVSNDSENRMSWCPCGCSNEVIHGNTGFGSQELWYGKPDIIVFPTGAGSVIVKTCKQEDFSEETDNDSERYHFDMLEERKNMSQIAKQGITFSFFQKTFQKNQNITESEFVSIIPTVALCAEGAHIYMYDTKYDIFLKSEALLPLWDETTYIPTLDLNTIITLWLMFNHLSLKPCFPEEMIKHLKGSCGFQKLTSHDKLEKIEKNVRMHQNIMTERSYKENFPEIGGFIPFT